MIYLAQSGNQFKIGYSDNPELRCTALQIGSPTPVVLVETFNGDKDTERALHAMFASKHVRGEWFDLTAEDIEHIAAFTSEPGDPPPEIVRGKRGRPPPNPYPLFYTGCGRQKKYRNGRAVLCPCPSCVAPR